MNERQIYEQDDAEIIRMVNSNALQAKERNARRREYEAEVEYVPGYHYSEAVAKRRIARILPSAARAGAGLVFIGGMVNGQMSPEFAVAGLAACIIWGIGHYWRKGHACM